MINNKIIWEIAKAISLFVFWGNNKAGGDFMKKQKKSRQVAMDMTESLRLDPEKRLCPIFDSETIAEFPVAARNEMGFRVLDNFTEEHIQ